MKLLRLWLLVVLAVLLPVRGVMAATMMCTPAGGPAHTGMSVDEAGQHDHSSHRHSDQVFDPAQHDHGKAVHGHASDDKCNVCSSTCSSPPLPSATAGIDEPRVLSAVSFPDLFAPAPTFQSDGQERPPRTI